MFIPGTSSDVNYASLCIGCRSTKKCDIYIERIPSKSGTISENRTFSISPSDQMTYDLPDPPLSRSEIVIDKITTTHEITVLCSAKLKYLRNDAKEDIQDIYTIHPVTPHDKYFILPACRHMEYRRINIIVIIPLEDGTRVSHIYFDDHLQLKRKTRVMDSDGWCFTYPQYEGSIFEADKPFSLYVGFDWIKVSVRPMGTWAKTYVAVGPEGTRSYFLNMHTYPRKGAHVTVHYYTNQRRRGVTTRKYRLNDHYDADFRSYQVELFFQSIFIKSNHEIGIIMNYDGRSSGGRYVMAMMVSDKAWVSSYFVCMPYNSSDVQNNLTLIAKKENFPAIRIDGKKVSMKTSALAQTNYHWLQMTYSKPMVIAVASGYVRPPTFVVYLHGSSMNGTYYTEAGLNASRRFDPSANDDTTDICPCHCPDTSLKRLEDIIMDNFWWFISLSCIELVVFLFIIQNCIRMIRSRSANTEESDDSSEDEEEEGSSPAAFEDTGDYQESVPSPPRISLTGRKSTVL